MDIVANIKQRYISMTNTQQKVLDFMVSDPHSMTFITLKELSAAVNVSEVTVLNTCIALGYENFNEVKYEFRKYVSVLCKVRVQADNNYASPLVPSRELKDKQDLLLQVCQEEFDMVQHFFSLLNMRGIFNAAKMIIEARMVVICGYGVSMQVADFMSMRLALLGIPSVVVNTESADSIQAALPLLAKDVLLVVISYPDYYLMTTKVAEFASSNDVPILVMTDSLKAPAAKYGDLTLICQTTTRLFLNTITLPLMLTNFITTAVSIEKSAVADQTPSAPEAFASFFASE